MTEIVNAGAPSWRGALLSASRRRRCLARELGREGRDEGVALLRIGVEGTGTAQDELLLVDDEEDTADLCRMLLQRALAPGASPARGRRHGGSTLAASARIVFAIRRVIFSPTIRRRPARP